MQGHVCSMSADVDSILSWDVFKGSAGCLRAVNERVCVLIGVSGGQVTVMLAEERSNMLMQSLSLTGMLIHIAAFALLRVGFGEVRAVNIRLG